MNGQAVVDVGKSTCGDQTTSNKFNLHSGVIFMDVGAWAGQWKEKKVATPVPGPRGVQFESRFSYVTQTDFGLVSGKDVLLCSWMNMESTAEAALPEGLATPLRSFLEQASQRRQQSPGAFVLGHRRAGVELTGQNELLVIIPDLHLPLLKGARGDIFRFDPCRADSRSRDQKLKSLEEELFNLLSVANLCEDEGGHRVTILQVGDCFEIWETQVRLLEDYDELSKWRDELNEKYGTGLTRGAAWTAFMPDHLRKMLNNGVMFPRVQYEFGKSIRDVGPGGFVGATVSLPPTSVFREGIVVDDSPPARSKIIKTPTETKTICKDLMQDAIKKGIMDAYPLLFGDQSPLKKDPNTGLPFMWLRGNHDNMLANSYYDGEKDRHVICRAEKDPLPKGPVRAKRQESLPQGLGEGDAGGWRSESGLVHAEHGHWYDEANADDLFDLPAQGYDLVRSFSLGVTGKGGKAVPIGWVLWLAGFLLGCGPTSSADEGALARDVAAPFDGMVEAQMWRVWHLLHSRPGCGLRLIVMGHTHRPQLKWVEHIKEYRKINEAIQTYPKAYAKWKETMESALDSKWVSVGSPPPDPYPLGGWRSPPEIDV